MAEEYLATKRMYREQIVDGQALVLRPAERARATHAQLPQQAAAEFLTANAADIGIRPDWLTGASLGVSEPAELPDGDVVELRFAGEKPHGTSTTVAFQQTWNGIPVWRRGTTVTVRTAPARVVGVQSTAFAEVHVDLPPKIALDARLTGQRGLAARGLALAAQGVVLASEARVADAASTDERAHIVSNRVVVFRYDAARRLTDETDRDEHEIGFPAELPPAPRIADGAFRLAREVIFSIPTPPRGRIVWLALLDAATGALLHLRPFTADVTGLVFGWDPLTQGGTALPASATATLNTFRSAATLEGLSAPPAGGQQALSGDHVAVQDFELATAAPPTEAVGGSFDYNSRTNNFAAVNAYVHCDAFFRLVESLGFPKAGYFGSTPFPLPVDHRGRFGSADGIEINASCSGNGMSGIANVDFELASTTDTTNPIGLATDHRVVLHELGGHGILYPHVNSANFGFAHSAGDSFGAVLADPDSQAADRFLTFPWVSSVIGRRHDRPVGGGWAWGGTNDVGGYDSEQILCTSHFRLYRSLGGDSDRVETRRYAARATAYLMLKGISTLTPMTNPSNVSAWVEALLEADADDWTSEGLAGGAYGKVIRWAFEKQGLFQAPGAPTPVAREGAAPAVDVYIDDGRHGEYQYQPVHWDNQNVWNRRFADNGTLHEDPLLGQTNFAYVRVRNRGSQTATSVVVRGFHCNPGAGLTWPDDWQPMTTAQLAVPDIAPGGETMVGPFEWTPSQPDHECLLMIASADGDPSNVDVFGPGESIPEWRLVPHDNNIAQRNVHPVPGGGGVRGIVGVLDGRRFTVRNPFDRRVKVELVTTLPSLLEERGWSVRFANPGGSAFGLAAGAARDVRLAVSAGGSVSRDDVVAAKDRDVVVAVLADGILIGGMTYRLDPDREAPMPQDCGPEGEPSDHPHPSDEDHCADTAEDLLECLGLKGHGAEKVRIRTIGVDIELDNC